MLMCKTHPRYKGVRYPVRRCQACLAVYWINVDGFRIMRDMSRLALRGS